MFFLKPGNLAALNVVKTRMKSIASIGKITKAMKMVAASKLRQDEKRMRNGIPFAAIAQRFMSRLPIESLPVSKEHTFVAMTSDKGLCGAINSSVGRSVRSRMFEAEASGKTMNFIGIGGKGTTALKRYFSEKFLFAIEDAQKVGWNFATACIIAEKILNSNPQNLFIFHNHFKSAISFETKTVTVPTRSQLDSMDKVEWSRVVDQYSFEPSLYEMWEDLYEFFIASSVFGCMLDGIAAEQSARMSAMDSASKNATEMLNKLTLQFNKSRQTKITTELCEIISGATAL